ncbi:hypothetical protein EVJ50_06100 [Synechococcus sp. RSCCF101]|uniref:hypothetical protein n=1 Tax=Synechococcus sp. RSCCF101 TaxID=2511069 RepID=UPI001244E78B|nr:hypothetical protein [Synechococcus sp. RSCCF101]QEY31878.1 hypothetical protein EVJ50_06100 [Synechococcus sp. RSCCF101]
MFRLRLRSDHAQIELIANGTSRQLPFQVVGPVTEACFIEELLEQEFGSLNLNPADLFRFLSDDPFVQEKFKGPDLIEGDLQSHANSTETELPFSRQALGSKLVNVGAIDSAQLDDLLEQYRPFSATQRFGEFLRLNMEVPPALLDLLLNPDHFDSKSFSSLRLGEKLVEVGMITPEQLQQALKEQRQTSGRLGECLVRIGAISEKTADFFSTARLSEEGDLTYAAV